MRYLFAHAHPDDESLSTGVLIAHLVDQGHEVHVLTGTRGERGEVVPGEFSHLAGTPALVARRENELKAALGELGAAGAGWLGAPNRIYRDSGMVWIAPDLAGPAEDTGEDALSKAELADVVEDLVTFASQIKAEIIVSYDSDGGYGHPDHVRMHEASLQAAKRLRIPFAAVVYAPGDGVEWFELPELVPRVSAALAHYTTQLTVVGEEIVHVGGQREPILFKVGLRRQ